MIKFDKIIGNPPFCRSLHLKILRQAMKYVDFDNGGEIVWLSPVRWLQDPIAEDKKASDYKRFKDIRMKLEDVEIINSRKAQFVFENIIISTALAVYKLSKNGSFQCSTLISPIIYKVFSQIHSWPTLEENKKDGWRVRFPLIIPGGSSGGSGNRKVEYKSFGSLQYFYEGKKDGKWWYEHYRTNQYSKTTETITLSVKLNSEIEAKNFVDSLNTNFGKYFINEVVVDVHINPKMILWMNDCVNPRTGLKGYQGEWTDDDFFDYFKLTNEERDLVKNTMAKGETK